jgi:hypothetical protein
MDARSGGPGRLADESSVARWYRFSYHLQPKGSDRALFPHQLRDGDAALFLAPVLEARGYSYGGPIFNYPHRLQAPTELIQVDTSTICLRPQDLLLLTTRPPLDDADEGLKTRVLRSHTTLEDRIFKHALRPHLQRCSRLQVIVAEEHARAFSGVASRRNMVFKLYRHSGGKGNSSKGDLGARIHKYLPHGSTAWRRPAQGTSVSAAFMIFEPHAWPGGPGLLAAFGMGGTETLVWAYMLRTRFPHLIATCRFVMAEIVEQELPDQPLTMDFADRWDIRLLTEDGASIRS